METWTSIFLPFGLILARISGFFAVLPIFGSPTLPMRVRAAAALLISIFFAMILPRPALVADVAPLAAGVLIAGEILCGLALGMAASLVFRGVQVGARFAGRQMGLAFASTVDPTSGEQAAPVAIIFETAFTLLFLVAGGHRLLLMAIRRSYEAFPVGVIPNASAMVMAIVKSGQAMLMFGLKLAAPVIAAFVVLSVILAVLARVLPEMNILMLSFPLRVGLGLFMAAAIMPAMNGFTIEIAQWMNKFLVS